MNCHSCGLAFSLQNVVVNDVSTEYALCEDCDLIWLAGENLGHLKVPYGEDPKQTSEHNCPTCADTLLDHIATQAKQVTSFHCRKCHGLLLEHSDHMLQHDLDLDVEPFGVFLTGVGLILRDMQQFKKGNQLPPTFHIEDAVDTDFKCPCCEVALTQYLVYDKNKDAGGRFEICDSCFGIWLDKGDQLNNDSDQEETTLEVDFESIVPSTKVCPKCRDINLFEMSFTTIDTEIDCCPACYGTWLDGGELHDFCIHLGRDDHDVIDALVDNAVFQRPALCKMLKHYSQTLHHLDSQVQEQEKNLKQASDIQARLIFGASKVESLKTQNFGDYEIASYWQPARTVGGDYFDLIPFDLDEVPHLGICIADVSGKGLPASLLMANFQALLRSFAPGCASPAELCTRLSPILYHNTAGNKYITAFYGVLNLQTGHFVYTNAGHNPPIIDDGENPRELKGGGTMLGLFAEWEYIEVSLNLGQDHRILFFTDGITETENKDGDDYGETRLIEEMKAAHHLKSREVLRRIVRSVLEFGHDGFHDDATLLLLSKT